MTQTTIVTDHYAEHLAEVQRRWDHALEAEGYSTAVIHSGSLITSFLDDYHYPFRPNPHFLQWLPLTHHEDCVLVIRPGRQPRLYYYQPDDYWYLPPSDPEAWWADHFDLVSVRAPDAWRQVNLSGRCAYIGDAPCLQGIAEAGDINPSRLVNRIHLSRTRKTAYEIACITQANHLAAKAHVEAERAFREGCSEYEIHQRYGQACGLLDHQLPYGNIIALNDHGSVLHYQQHEHRAPDALRSFLIDAGATQQGYCSDITRTYAAGDGDFSAMIDAMDGIQQELCAALKAGTDYRDLHIRTHHLVAGILEDFDVIRVTAAEAVDTGLSSVFFPHGLGHFLGIQTHDVAGLISDENGTEIPRPEGHPFLRLTRVLEPGNVLTVEPGLYFIDTLLKKWRANGGEDAVNWRRIDELSPYGGIRIEDDMLVTDGQAVNLSRPALAAASPR